MRVIEEGFVGSRGWWGDMGFIMFQFVFVKNDILIIV
jgi:hypothetical protein